ncbi:hypothetical protein QOZ80_8BG0646590 [Eleusine coracana subsp. coracana]|nr:hypothetical protein QOZ80_8BG0646590 [Eleusine coracana subsp. coracana]
MGVIILNVGPSETLSISRDLCITAMSLQTDPAAYARGLQSDEVNAWAQVVGHDASRCAIGTVSAASPIVELRPRLVVNDKFLLWHDAPAATVRFYARLPHSVAGEVDEESSRTAVLEYAGEEDEERVVEEVDEEASTWVEFRPLSEEEEAERFDSDNDDDDEGDEEDDDEPPRKVVMASEAEGESSNNSNNVHPQQVAVVVPPDGGEFLGPARFAAVENTAGFMRVAAATEDDEATTDEGNNKEIVVLYRYTRFSRTWSGRKGVEACRRTKLHRLHFNVPPGGDVAGSLAWAGAALGPLVYPALFRRQLQELWTTLLSLSAMSAVVPPGATRLQVIVDAAILRREDYTEERMGHVRAALEAKMREEWPGYCHIGMDLHLPEPVMRRRRREEDEQGGEDDVTPAVKRRKIIADDEEVEDCAVCFDTMERGLAAWPGCRHVFHGACLERTLARSDMCPLCRNKLCAG